MKHVIESELRFCLDTIRTEFDRLEEKVDEIPDISEIDLSDVTQSNTTTTVTLSGTTASFAVVDSVVVDSKGRVTGKNTKTVTLPASVFVDIGIYTTEEAAIIGSSTENKICFYPEA
jgi:hypothetical protein